MSKAQVNKLIRELRKRPYEGNGGTPTGVGKRADNERFPPEKWVMDQFVKQPREEVYINEDGDISHPEVTKAYVQRFCENSHYK